MHRRLHRADFLLYWAMFWLAIAANLAANRVVAPFSPRGSTPALTGLSPNRSFLFKLMISEALSLEGNLSKQGARTLPAGSGVVALLVGVYLSSPY